MWFSLFEISGLCKSIEAESRSVVAWACMWDWGLNVNRHKRTFWGNKNVLQLDYGDGYKTIDLPKPSNFNGLPLVAQTVKNLIAMWETWVWSLVWKDPLEKEMATHSSILAWRIPWTEEPGGLQPMGSKRVGDDWATNIT